MSAQIMYTTTIQKPAQVNEQQVLFAIHSDYLMRIKTFMILNNIPFTQSESAFVSSETPRPVLIRESIPDRVARLGLSNRERDVLVGLANGGDYKSIAGSLFISVETTRSHIKSIYRKLGVKNRGEAVALLLK